MGRGGDRGSGAVWGSLESKEKSPLRPNLSSTGYLKGVQSWDLLRMKTEVYRESKKENSEETTKRGKRMKLRNMLEKNESQKKPCLNWSKVYWREVWLDTLSGWPTQLRHGPQGERKNKERYRLDRIFFYPFVVSIKKFQKSLLGIQRHVCRSAILWRVTKDGPVSLGFKLAQHNFLWQKKRKSTNESKRQLLYVPIQHKVENVQRFTLGVNWHLRVRAAVLVVFTAR